MIVFVCMCMYVCVYVCLCVFRIFSDCINLVAKMTIGRLSFGTVFFVGGGTGFWRRQWGHSLKAGKSGANFHVFRIDTSCANIGASVEVKRN